MKLTITAGLLALSTTAGLFLSCAGVPASAASSRATTATTVTELTAVSCVSSTRCWAEGSYAGGTTSQSSATAILTTTDGGADWSVQHTISGLVGGVAMDCPTTSACLASLTTSSGEPEILATNDGGTTWDRHTLPKSISLLSGISCPSAAKCWAVGDISQSDDVAILSTTDMGSTWATQTTKLTIPMSSTPGISCSSTRECVVLGYGGLRTTDGGEKWLSHGLPKGQTLDNVSCPSTTVCVADGNVTSAVPQNEQAYLDRSGDGGARFTTALADAPSVTGLSGLSCSSTAHCVSVGGGYSYTQATKHYSFWAAVETTSNGGSSWSQAKQSQSWLTGVSCATGTNDCVAVGTTGSGRGAILRSTNYGQTWTAERVPRA